MPPSFTPTLFQRERGPKLRKTLDAMANGGKIVQPIGVDAPEITARFSDPAGNVLGLYQEPAAEAVGLSLPKILQKPRLDPEKRALCDFVHKTVKKAISRARSEEVKDFEVVADQATG